MKFNNQDENEVKIQKVSPPLNFPEDVGEAPPRPGAFILLDRADEILYVGAARDLRSELEADIVHIPVRGKGPESVVGSDRASGAVRFRYFRTEDAGTAEELARNWAKKYDPPNNG